jgi:hemoglobin
MNEYDNDTNTYRAARVLAGITSLVDAFYSNMDNLPEARVIRKMHLGDLTESRKTHVLSVRNARRPSAVY